jgi:hypothetical protein
MRPRRVRQARQGALGDWPEDPRRSPPLFLDLVGARHGAALPEAGAGRAPLRAERGPWEAEIPLDELAAASFPSWSSRVRTIRPSTRSATSWMAALAPSGAVIPSALTTAQRNAAPFNEPS